MMRHWKWIGFLGIIVAAIGLLFLPEKIPVDQGVVSKETLRQWVEEDGRTRVRHRYSIQAPVTGMLQRPSLRPGDEVETGETILAVIEPHLPAFLDARLKAETEARVKRARAAKDQAQQHLQAASTSLAFAKKELKRLQNLGAIVSSESLDAAGYTLDLRKSEEAAARKALRVAEFELESQVAASKAPGATGGEDGEPLRLMAPIDGRVFRVFQESGGPVQAGTSVLEIADPRDLEVVVDLLSRDAVKVRSGQLVSLKRWGGEAPLEGRVRIVEPSGFTKISALGVEEQRVNILIDITNPPEEWSQLGDGFRVEAAIVIWEQAEVLTVPVSALFWDEEQWFVFRVEDGKAMRTALTLGKRNSQRAQVVAGLQSGQWVILHPSDQISDGVSVKKRN